jgi:hypothetical protein
MLKPLIVGVIWGSGIFVILYVMGAAPGISYGLASMTCLLAFQAEYNYCNLMEMNERKVKK